MSLSEIYINKDHSYFTAVRFDVLEMLPFNCGNVLEVGCGNGATLVEIKRIKQANSINGLELTDLFFAEAKSELDQLWIGDAEELIVHVPNDEYDFILCLDLLEHLKDPWSFIDELHKKLKPGGKIIASIPNIRTLRVIFNLLMKGKFEYADKGIMDRTHLRFFTKSSIIQLMLSNNKFKINSINSTKMAKWSNSWMLNKITLNLFSDLLAEQYLVCSQKLN